MKVQVVEVAVFAPLLSNLDYAWDNALGEPSIGIRVVVPLGNGKRVGLVVGMPRAIAIADVGPTYKTVLDRLDIEPLVSAKRLHWLGRAAAYQLTSLGEMLETACAWAGHDKKRKFRCLSSASLAQFDPTLATALISKRAFSLATMMQRLQSANMQWRVLNAKAKGLLEEVIHDEAVTSVPVYQALTLRDSQRAALAAIDTHAHSFFPMLLFGCTGSGKTEVYLQAAKHAITRGEQVLILVPEIGLTPMWLSRLNERFSKTGIWHSGLKTAEKIQLRHKLKDVQVVLGTRSALFLPLPKLGLIVVDEEHDTSYKQQDGVQYSARDLSLLLAQELKIPLVLGSATPSLESWRQVKQGVIPCYRLTERVYQHTQINPEVVDMRGSHDVISPQLLARLQSCHARGEQSILYLNRRGYAPALQCTSCGDVPSCPACSVHLTLHRKAALLRCHACGWERRVVQACLQCGEKAYLPLGSGTERLEDDLAEMIPTLRIARFDRDVVRQTRDLNQVLSDFAQGEIDCLVGTQMLVKGHHFPNVTLVGVINADLGMNLPDFRASERWWQQMTQVFGRTGRGEQTGVVVVQTWSPDAPWFTRLDESRAEEVLNDELSLREMTSFPPYARWVRIVFSSTQQHKAGEAAYHFAQQLRLWGAVKVSGPMPCAMERLANRYRVEIIIQDPSKKHLPWQLMPLLQACRTPSGVRRKVDVDPIDFM